ncbi:tetratricopeptide repeat protein [Roseospira visakhapatnamensis]|uniref:Flp pilus assembly protein TadD n=1 Tax=Roseospira visakhapatnamensis TaxID=390880 RepID=A0A7W6WB80_9PROT|nr:tetratricopeptide repeat protein [Roseospira visakhapatnamensis]MBB4268040.1 Flp pilus assembly protein TadD [Roseospira visakhapatnamensis]
MSDRGRAAATLVIPLAVVLALGACATPADPGSPEGDRTEVLFRTLESMARQSEARNDYAKAVEQYGRLATEDPDNETYILGVARNQRYAGEPVQALRLLRRALTREHLTETVPVRLERGRALLAAGMLSDARAEVEALRRDAPTAPGVHGLAGLVADRDGRHAEAQAAYRAALDLNPDDLRSANNLALSLAVTGSLDEAIALQTRTTRHLDATIQMRQNLALLHALAGNMGEAERITRDVLPEDRARRVVADLWRLSGHDGTAAATLGDGSAMP